MKYVTRQDDISILPLSVRLSNCLHRTNIHTIGEMMDYPQANDWAAIRNMGVKSIDEVNRWIELLQHGSQEYCLVDQATKAQAAAAASASMDDAELDPTIEELSLSVRARNCLRSVGIEHASQLLGKSVDDLLQIRSMGMRTAQEVFSAAEQWLGRRTVQAMDLSAQESHEKANDTLLSTEISKAYNASQSVCLHEIMRVRHEYPEAQGETFFYRLYEAKEIRDAAKLRILKLLERNRNELTPKALGEHLPMHLMNTTITEELLLELEADEQVSLGEALIVRRYPSIVQYVSELEDERAREILQGRLDGKTLEEIGNQYGITRERIRQIICKQQRIIRKQGLRFREDQYAEVFSGYLFDKEDFALTFDEPESTYHYLDMICTSSAAERKPLETMLEDQSIPVEIRKQAERAVYKHYLTIDGVRVRMQRSDFAYHVVKTRCRELTLFDDFLRYYTELLEAFDLQDEPSFQIDNRSYENKLQRADYVLWNQWRSLRYYEINSRDYEDLLDGLNLSQYENCEISTLKLYRDNPELMVQYDIRDEYELHNLLKKICDPEVIPIHFGRMPTLEFGTANRDEQVLDLLLQCAPITAEDFGRAYEEAYGVKAVTVISNYMQSFDEFYYNGIYSIDAENLPPEQFAYMQQALSRDYYTIADVRRIFIRQFPEANATSINPYTLKTLEFRVYTDYIIRNTYSSSTAYFDALLGEADIVDAREFPKSMFMHGAYSGELGKLRQSRRIVEFAPHRYINIRRLNASGVTLDMLEDYCTAVRQFVEPNAYFTISSIRQDGFSHPMDDLGFDDWFYSSVLLEDRAHFAYSRMGGARLFRRGSDSISFADMLRWIVEAHQKMDIYELCTLLEERYGIVIRKDKLTYMIQNTDLYYDAIMETVYMDYDTYFEEV